MLDELKQYAIDYKIPIIRDESLKLLIDYIREIKPLNILEIGTAIGYSGMIMLENSSSIVKLTTIEIDEDRAEFAKKNFYKAQLSDRVKLIIGDANEIIPCIKVKYDFILLDGPKGHYNELLPYLINMLNRNGVIFADNVLYLGLVEGEDNVIHKHRTIVNNMRKFINEITNNKELETKLYNIDDGIIIGRKI